jgi:outer membrane protein W
MSRRTRHPAWHFIAAPVAALLIAPVAVSAQAGGPGFLFQKPHVQLELRTGYSIARAGSDIYSFVTDSLTLNRSDFNAFMIGGQLAFRLTDRWSGALDLAYAGGSRPSQERYWLDNNNLPIQQTTTFSRVPLTLRVKYYLLSRGQSISRFAWIPAGWAPYVGVGAGVMWYTFKQSGDFVDAQTLNVFSDRFRSSGSAPTVDAFAGVDVSLNRTLVLTGEARYDWARATMGQDFVGFNKIDLSGLQASLGLAVRF